MDRTRIAHWSNLSNIGTFIFTVIILFIMVLSMAKPSNRADDQTHSSQRSGWGMANVWIMPSILAASVFGAAIFNFLAHGRSQRNPQEAESTPSRAEKQLTIHHAVYAAGLPTEVSVTKQLQTLTRDAIVVTIDDKLGGLLPNDPAYGIRKRLDVDYSYGSDTIVRVSRFEAPPGQLTRLLLPEDFEVKRLANDIERIKQKTANEIAQLKTQHSKNLDSLLAVAEEKHRQALLTAEQRHRQELAAAQQNNPRNVRNWDGDWKELATQFREVRHRLNANWSRTSSGEHWDVSGDNNAVRRFEALRKHAGNLLVASPKVSQTIPSELRQYPAGDRWLSYLKATTRAFRTDGYGTETSATGETFNVMLGSIPDIAEASANACIECAGQELIP